MLWHGDRRWLEDTAGHCYVHCCGHCRTLLQVSLGQEGCEQCQSPGAVEAEPKGTPATGQVGSRPLGMGIPGMPGAAPCLGLLCALHPQLVMCSPRSGLAMHRVGTRMQRLHHSDKPEKEALARNLSAHRKHVFLPQESCGKDRALDLDSFVAMAGLWGRDVF